MTTEELAAQMREKQTELGRVPKALIERMSDEAMILSYIRCQDCGTYAVSFEEALEIAEGAGDLEEWWEGVMERQDDSESCQPLPTLAVADESTLDELEHVQFALSQLHGILDALTAIDVTQVKTSTVPALALDGLMNLDIIEEYFTEGTVDDVDEEESF